MLVIDVIGEMGVEDVDALETALLSVCNLYWEASKVRTPSHHVAICASEPSSSPPTLQPLNFLW